MLELAHSIPCRRHGLFAVAAFPHGILPSRDFEGGELCPASVGRA